MTNLANTVANVAANTVSKVEAVIQKVETDVKKTEAAVKLDAAKVQLKVDKALVNVITKTEGELDLARKAILRHANGVMVQYPTIQSDGKM